MKIITAIENKKINEQLKKINNIEILNSDIQYKEGILEYLEKNKKLDLIILKEILPGQINLIYLIKEIQKINKKIKIILLLKNNYFEKYEKINNVEYVYLEKISLNNILKLLYLERKINIEKNNKINMPKIILVSGNSGSGKTIVTIIISKILDKIKNKKVLLINEFENKSLIKIFFKNNYKNIIYKNEIINLKNNIYLLNINYLINNKKKISEYLNKIKNKFDFIFIENKNIYFNKYKKIANKEIYLFESNIVEIEKGIKYLNKDNMEIIINKKNIHTIDKEIIEKIVNKKILEEINYNKNINLFINNNFNLNCLNKNQINKFLKIINKMEE